MKVIVAGSRNIISREIVFTILDDAREKLIKVKTPITEVVCGDAIGVDKLGSNWALSKSIPVKSFPAYWNKFGRKARLIRIQEMGEYADSLIAIWDGESSGTKHMIDVMNKLNKPHRVFIISEEVIKKEYDKYSYITRKGI